jgi:hypothetical protein
LAGGHIAVLSGIKGHRSGFVIATSGCKTAGDTSHVSTATVGASYLRRLRLDLFQKTRQFFRQRDGFEVAPSVFSKSENPARHSFNRYHGLNIF